MNKKYWTTAGGDDIPLRELEESHLLNILHFIEKRAETGLLRQVGGGGWDVDDMWYDEWTIEGDEVLEYFNYKDIIKEIKRRKLKIVPKYSKGYV